MKKFALIFPGQGSQKTGMGKDLYENSLAAKNVFDTADRVLGRKISEICFYGTDEELKNTLNSQPCILAVEIAILEALKEKFQIDVSCAAGHSLGEYAALYSAGFFDLETVFKLINKRAELMNECSNSSQGSMAAVLGLDDEIVSQIVSGINDLFVANYNCPGQVVVTGSKSAIDNCIEIFKSNGAKKVIPLSVSGAFHSPFMSEASEKFFEYINEISFTNPKFPVYTNFDSFATNTLTDIKTKMSKQIDSSVLWTKSINNIINSAAMDFIEIGPGKVLAGLNKKINSEINTYNISDWESLCTFVEEVSKNEEKELV